MVGKGRYRHLDKASNSAILATDTNIVYELTKQCLLNSRSKDVTKQVISMLQVEGR